MKRCIVVGAGGCGREVMNWALHVRQGEWRVVGFLDSNPAALDGTNTPYPILGDPLEWKPAEDEVFVAGLGDPAVRLRVCRELQKRGAHFLTIIHPTAVTALNAEIGEGCVISPNAVISSNVKLGAFVYVNIAASIGHDSRIGEGTTVSCHCDVMGYSTVGRLCFLGGHSCILPKKKVRDGAVVGAGSVVVRTVAERTTVMGVPAQVLISAKPR